RLASAMQAPDRTAMVRGTLEACALALERSGASRNDPACALTVPGRIEVLGKHTDYAGGRSILAAPERGVTLVAVPRDDARVRVHDVSSGERVELALDPAMVPGSGWANYPATAARRLARDFPGARTGAEIAFASDLPPASGMSSSSAFLVAVFQALAAVNGVEETVRWRENVATREDLAGYLSTVENGQAFGTLPGDLGVGTQGGSEDHTAMTCARPGSLVRYAFAPVRFERELPVPAGHRFAIASSGVRAEKTGAARERYNRASELMRAAAALWREATGRDDHTVGAALDSAPDAAGRLREVLAATRDARYAPEELLGRVEQFIVEDREVIPAASEALSRGDLAAFGAAVDRSQELAERLLGNQTPETAQLARRARELGAAAASAFGAGFGGSVWALVADGEAGGFLARWRADYLARFPGHEVDARFFTTRAGPPLARII
ncbi:MAG TPA: galactokinase family protein, partial [Gemmatimonadaceae bacterium]|nr:galactokinase family protein [Gemmatimonadaceae bacterium]